MQCIVLLGGLGTRMEHVAPGLPKSLLPVGPRTFLEWQLAWLGLCGVTEAVLALGYGAEAIEECLKNSELREYFPRYRASYDGPEPCGTGGAISRALSLLGDDFLVTYGDSFLFVDPVEIMRRHLDARTPLTLSIYRNSNLLDVSNVEYREARILAYSKTARTERMQHIDYGLFALNKFRFMLELPSFPGGRPFDIASYISKMVEAGAASAVEVEQRFYEVGSPSGYSDFCEFIQGEEFNLRKIFESYMIRTDPRAILEARAINS